MEELRAARERGGLSALEDFNVSAKPYESALQQLFLSLCVHILKKKLANPFVFMNSRWSRPHSVNSMAYVYYNAVGGGGRRVRRDGRGHLCCSC